MDIKITPAKLSGRLTVIPSKSQAHRMMICAAFADAPTVLICPETSRDMDATAGCLNALGADIRRTASGYSIYPIRDLPGTAELYCHDSGSTLRFLLPLAGALGVETRFHLEGRLPQRPLSPMWEEMERMGCCLSRPSCDTILCSGKLLPGNYSIRGDVSSQFITGLLLACSRIDGYSRISVIGKLESAPYVDMTVKAMEVFGMPCHDLMIHGGKPFHTPGKLTVEGDWSNGAFFLAAGVLGCDIETEGLLDDSPQGDRACAQLLPALAKSSMQIDATDIPDLVPILAVTAACCSGAEFTGIRRLRLKESDRVASVVGMICALGGKASADEDRMIIYGTGLTGGIVDAGNDHRIAMSASVAACCCQEPVVILGAECVEKSYPRFYEEYRRLGGNYEQYLRQ